MKTGKLFGAAILALALASCGGGDSGSPPPTGGGGGTPAPTPTPSPTPSPITYTKFADLTGDQTFKTACGGVEQAFGNINPIAATGFGEGLGHAYAASTQTWTISLPTFSQTFGPAELQPPPNADTISYRKPNAVGAFDRFFVIARPFGAQPTEYTRASRSLLLIQSGQFRDYFCVFGVPTLVTDTRPASTVTYSPVNIGGSAIVTGGPAPGQYDLADSTATLSANPASGEVTTTITLVGRLLGPSGPAATPTALGTYTGTANVVPNVANFNAGLQSANVQNIFSNFGGWFFGPQGIEAAYAFNIRAQLPDGSLVNGAGAVAGRR